MTKYILTSDKFAGEVEIKFKEDGSFSGIDFSPSTVSEKQQVWFLKHLPAKKADLQFYRNSAIWVAEVTEKCDFKTFWDRYDDKLNSSKKKAEAKWNKMKQIEQIKALNFIPVYFSNIPSGTRKKYATTYLADELWNN